MLFWHKNAKYKSYRICVFIWVVTYTMMWMWCSIEKGTVTTSGTITIPTAIKTVVYCTCYEERGGRERERDFKTVTIIFTITDISNMIRIPGIGTVLYTICPISIITTTTTTTMRVSSFFCCSLPMMIFLPYTPE